MVNFPNPKNSENLAAVIGLPVRHSLSPLIYNTAFRIDSLNWDFHAVEVSEGQMEESIEFVRNNNIKGLSVTMPLKEVILPYLDQLTEAAKELKAVNCVYWNEGELIGDNTDGDGFLMASRMAFERSNGTTRIHVPGTYLLQKGGGGEG